jgi:hypothetical protein
MKIRQVIKEAAGVTAAFAFGRFNPAHQGHIAVWQTVERAGVKWYIGTNPTTIGANDPLTFEQKSAWMQAIYPQITGHIVPETSVMTLAARIFKELGSKEDATIAYITDADDWAWSGKLLNQYNGVEGKHGYYKFAQIVHVPSPRVSSATALRDAARADSKVAFYQASGTDPKLKVAGKTYFDTVKEAVTKYPLPVKKVKKVAEGDSPGMKDGRPYSDPLRRHPGNDSYMTPEYLIQKYQDELKKIAAGPYKRPKDVAMYKARIAKLQRQQGVTEDVDRAEAQADYMQGQCMILAVAINQYNPKRYPIGYIWEYNISPGAPDIQLDDDEWEYLSPEEQEEISNDISRHSVVHAYVRDQETNEYIDARGRHNTLPNLWGRLGQTRFEEFPGTARELIDITAHGDWDEVGDQVSFKRGQPAFDSLAGPAGVKRALDYAVKYLGVVGPESAKALGVTEVSTELRNRYVTRASDDYSNANFASRVSKDHPGLDDYSRQQAQRAKKRAAGLNRALSDKRLGRNPSMAEDEQKTVAKTWDQMTPQEKSSGVKGRTVWNEQTQRYYTVFDVPVKQTNNQIKS